jgi:hypothetical protein
MPCHENPVQATTHISEGSQFESLLLDNVKARWHKPFSYRLLVLAGDLSGDSSVTLYLCRSEGDYSGPISELPGHSADRWVLILSPPVGAGTSSWDVAGICLDYYQAAKTIDELVSGHVAMHSIYAGLTRNRS